MKQFIFLLLLTIIGCQSIDTPIEPTKIVEPTPSPTLVRTATMTATPTQTATATTTPTITPDIPATQAAQVAATRAVEATQTAYAIETVQAEQTAQVIYAEQTRTAALVQEPYLGIWISRQELIELPTSGPAWEHLLETASKKAGEPDLGDQNDDTNVIVLAKALVFAKTGVEDYREDVVIALNQIAYQYSENNGRTLALGRELAAYVIAADLINLPEYDATLNANFEARLVALRNKWLDGKTLTTTHEVRPNNWGTHAGASRLAVALYLQDQEEIERVAQIFRGWIGERDRYAEFEYGSDLSWQCDSEEPVGINPAGCTIDGHDVGGAQPEEMRRGDEFQWPPVHTNYPWEALQGSLVQAELLQRAGYDAWNWGDQALLRAVQFLFELGWEPEGDDQWEIWLVNDAYGTGSDAASVTAVSPAIPGKNMGFTDWTHGGIRDWGLEIGD